MTAGEGEPSRGHVWDYPQGYPQMCMTSAHVAGTKVHLASSLPSTNVDGSVDSCSRQTPQLWRCGMTKRRCPG